MSRRDRRDEPSRRGEDNIVMSRRERRDEPSRRGEDSIVMSRRERRDEPSRRIHSSRSDRSPSPKRSRRDGKPATERTHDDKRLESTGPSERERKQRNSLKDALPLEDLPAPEDKMQLEVVNKENPGKEGRPTDGNKFPSNSNSTEVPRSRSYLQHDDRGSAGNGIRSFSSRGTGRWSDPKEKHSHKDLAKVDETDSWKHDRFHEMDAETPPAKKRPAFREKKEPMEPPEKSEQPLAPEKSERPSFVKEERNFRRGDRPFNRETPRSAYQSRDRYSAWSRRGRDRFVGRSGEESMHRHGPVEKWSHDMFEEANKTPPRKNDEEQIAKIEALLSM